MLAIYITLIISIYILYLTIRHKYIICPSEMKLLVVEKPKEPIKVSEIFQQMFSDVIIPGTVQLEDGSRI